MSLKTIEKWRTFEVMIMKFIDTKILKAKTPAAPV